MFLPLRKLMAASSICHPALRAILQGLKLFSCHVPSPTVLKRAPIRVPVGCLNIVGEPILLIIIGSRPNVRRSLSRTVILSCVKKPKCSRKERSYIYNLIRASKAT